MLRRTSLYAVLFVMTTAVAMGEEIPQGPSLYIGVTTNSIFRGVSQTSDQNFYSSGGMTSMTGHGRMSSSTTTTTDTDIFAPAVYGGFDYLHSSGLYVGIDATSINIPGFDAFARVDGSAGYLHNFNSGWSIDVGAVAYVYPGESGSNFWEVYGGVGYGPVSGYVWHDPDNNNTYYQGRLHFDIGSGVQLYLTAGHYSLDLGPSYDDYSIRLSKSFGGWTVGGAVVDTTLDDPIPYAWVQYRFAL